jgi:hypothetical protein
VLPRVRRAAAVVLRGVGSAPLNGVRPLPQLALERPPVDAEGARRARDVAAVREQHAVDVPPLEALEVALLSRWSVDDLDEPPGRFAEAQELLPARTRLIDDQDRGTVDRGDVC